MTLREISKMCDTVGAPMCAFCDGPGWVKLLFVMPEAEAETVLARIQKLKADIDQNRPAGVCFYIIPRFMEMPAIEATGAMERLVGTDEVLKQVFQLEPNGDWT